MVPIVYSGSIERTSFQEMNEEKVFLEFDIDEYKSIKFKTHILPTRPMLKLILDKSWHNDNYISKFKQIIEKLDENSIVKIDSIEKRNYDFLKFSFLKEIFPKSINIEISRKLFR